VLDPQLLQDFMRGFFGYGNLGANYWFVGLEEGGGKSLNEIERRLEAWHALGRPEVADLEEFHERAGVTRWSVAKPPLQSTWKQLIRVVLAAEGQDANVEAIRTFQRDHLGRQSGTTALIELMPLPSPSTSEWLYASAGIGIIGDRSSYSAAILDERIAAIRNLIAAHHPPFVVFYGLKRRDVWSSIAGAPFVDQDAGQFAFHSTPETLFLMIKHPVAWGAKNEEYEAAGRFVNRW
jgi:hypothetical protein